MKNRELELLTSLAVDPGEPNRALVLLRDLRGVDWRRWERMALASGLAGRVRRSLVSVESTAVPAETMRILAAGQLLAGAHNRLLMEEATTLCLRAGRAGIPLVPIKGAALLLSRAYAEYGDRAMVDVDVVCLRKDYDDVACMLAAAGYRPCADALAARHHHHNVGFRKTVSSKTVLVELHWTPYHALHGDQIRDEQALSRAAVDPTRACSVAMLDSEDTILSLMLHLANHRFRGPLRWYVDLDAVLATAPTLDWEKFWARARDLGAARATAFGLWLCGAVLGRPLARIPPELKRQVAFRVMQRVHAPSLVLNMTLFDRWTGGLIDLLNFDHAVAATRNGAFKVAELLDRKGLPTPASIRRRHFLHSP